MAARTGRRMLATVFTLVLLGAPGVLHAQFKKSLGKLTSGGAANKTFTFETFNAGLCSSQPKPTLTIHPDGRQDFSAQVRSNGAKDTYQAFVRYFKPTGAFLYEVKWWQQMMEKPGIWYNWKVNTKADPDLAAKLKDIKKVTINYKC
jgi:hypothetical protein